MEVQIYFLWKLCKSIFSLLIIFVYVQTLETMMYHKNTYSLIPQSEDELLLRYLFFYYISEYVSALNYENSAKFQLTWLNYFLNI
jgi:hypothetical protein